MAVMVKITDMVVRFDTKKESAKGTGRSHETLRTIYLIRNNKKKYNAFENLEI